MCSHPAWVHGMPRCSSPFGALARGVPWWCGQSVPPARWRRQPHHGGGGTLIALSARLPLSATGVELVVSDDHAGLKKAIREVLPEAAWGSALTCTSCVTPWTPCPARPTTTAPKELCWPLRPQRHAGGAARLGSLDRKMARQVPKAGGLGGVEHRGDPHLLSPARAGRPATRSPQAQEEHQQARAPERRDPPLHPRGAHLPQRRVVPSLGARPSRPHREGPARMPALPAEKSRKRCERREGSLSGKPIA